MKIVRTQDWSVLATIPAIGDIGISSETGGVRYREVRFCEGDRFGMLANEGERVTAWTWNPTSGVQQLAASVGLSVHEPKAGDNQVRPVGWSDRCELIAFGRSDSRYRKDANPFAEEPEETRIPVRILGYSDRTFVVAAPQGVRVDVMDVTADALLISTWGHTRIDIHRLGLIDRRSGNVTFIPRTLTRSSSWARLDGRSFAIVPAFGEPPRVLRLGETPDAATKAAFAARPVPPPPEEPTNEDVSSVFDATSGTLAIYDGRRIEWWSVFASKKLGSQTLEPFESSWGFQLSLVPSPDATKAAKLVIAENRLGDLFAAKPDGVVYRRSLRISTCGQQPCTSGNRSDQMRTETSPDRVLLAVGSFTGEVVFDLSMRTMIVDLTTGRLDSLPASGRLVGFVGGHERLAIGEDVWSTATRRVVGHLPD